MPDVLLEKKDWKSKWVSDSNVWLNLLTSKVSTRVKKKTKERISDANYKVHKQGNKAKDK